MSDNVDITPGTGKTIAADDIGGVLHQRVKLSLGADGVASDAPVGGGVESGALRVTVATDSTGVLSVDDNGASITVDGTVAATQSGTWNVTNVSGTVSLPTGAATAAKQPALGTAGTPSADVITVQGITSMTALKVDGSAVTQPVSGTVGVSGTVTVGSHAVTNAGTFAIQVDGAALTALQLIDDVVLVEDTAHVSGDKGVMPLAVRRDTNTTLADTTGDYAPLQVDASGSLKVAIISGAGSGGTASQDNAAYTPGTSNFTPIGGEVDDTGTSDATENSAAAVRMTTKRAIHVNLRDAAGAELSVGGGTQYDEDTAHVSGDKVTMAGVVRQDTAAALSGTDGDRTCLIADASGRLHVNVGNTVTVGSHAVTNAGTFVTQENGAALTSLQLLDDVVFAEDVAATTGDKGIPSLAVRQDTISSSTSADGDYGNLKVNSVGRLYTSATIDAALPAGSNTIGALTANQSVNVAQINGVAPTMGNGASGTGVQRVTIANDSTGQVAITGTVTVGSHAVTNAGTFAVQNNAATPAGTNAIGTVGLDNTGTGYSISRVLSAASTNATSAKASAGRVHGWFLYNANAAVRYLKLYNKASAPTVGTDTPVMTIPIPAGAAANVEFVRGITFATGIAYALTTGVADNDNTGVAANELVINLLFV